VTAYDTAPYRVMHGMSGTIILVSPAPVDGYPPVQHQARLLADAGYAVDLVTVPLAWGDAAVRFSHPGVSVHVNPARGTGGVAAGLRMAEFVSSILALRRRHAGRPLIEIAYEPIGMLYSDLAPMRPKLRIAHFHECLMRLDSLWLEKRVRKSIHGYQLAVVADADRAVILRDQLGLSDLPHVVPNYPMHEAPRPVAAVDPGGPFGVVYCGSVGLNQKLDLIIDSVAHWPPGTVFRIIGNDQSEIARNLRRRAESAGVADRVIFEGWVPYDQVQARLMRSDLGILLLDPSSEQRRTALGASNKRYQYMQAALPQIGDMNPGVAELLEGQGIGRCLAAFCPEQLAALVAGYSGDRARSRAEGDRAYALHEQRYNYQQAFRPVLEWIGARAGRLPDAGRPAPRAATLRAAGS